jgi:carbon-monoxide dehydrogenase large subunit
MSYLAPGSFPPGTSPELVAAFDYDGGQGGWSQGTHCCWVEVDVRTGEVHLLRYLVVEDCGTMINPAIVEGQVRGGVAQGIGGVLYEHAAYDDQGAFLATTLHEYLVPTASEIPTIDIDHLETPSMDPVNFRGVGEGGALCAPATVANAVADALAPFGSRITEQPLTPTAILKLMGVIT